MPRIFRSILPTLTVLAAVVFGAPLLAAGGIDGRDVKTLMAIPFAGILLSIAILPLVAPHWWHHNFGKVSAGWSVVAAAIMFFTGGFGSGDVMYEYLHIILLDYVPFIILLLGLFTIAGGIRIKGQLRGSPGLNVGLLLIGTILASLMGTTGAAMLMIRPLLKANDWRKRKVHLVVFFIFLVCNIGGSMTPLGDPPLFLGFLRGVDFFWTLDLAPETGFLTVALLAIFFLFDKMMLAREEFKVPPVVEGESSNEKFGIEGRINFLLLGCLIGAILLSSTLAKGAFWDQKAADEYSVAIAAGEERAIALKQAMAKIDEKDWAAAQAAYQQAIKKNWELNQAKPDEDHADDGHDHADDGHQHANAPPEAAPVFNGLISDAPAKDADDDLHKGHDHGIFSVGSERLAERGLDKDAYANFTHGLEGRLSGIAELAKGAKGVTPEGIKSLVLLDYQRSVGETNTLRTHQSHDATMGLHLPLHVTFPWANLVRDLIILLLALISWKVTSRESRKKNGFSWFPIVEVAKLFIGIFICIVPALKILQAGVDGELAGVVNAVTDPNGNAINAMYFWLTGGLSAFLDNAPTYLVFFNTAGGNPQFLMTDGHDTLLAISMGAVFMGAMTYIGNAPNFMVKAIAEENAVRMPSFFGYMLWSIGFLIPLFIIVMFIAKFV
jgi:Na+/H+ antiporter NhaD/arsenite permease-like protein